MPNTHTTLTSLFSDIADAIRAKTGGTADIVADEFPDAIAGIEGGSAVIEPLTVTENGTYTAPEGVDGYSPVTVNTEGTNLRQVTRATVAEETSMYNLMEAIDYTSNFDYGILWAFIICDTPAINGGNYTNNNYKMSYDARKNRAVEQELTQVNGKVAPSSLLQSNVFLSMDCAFTGRKLRLRKSTDTVLIPAGSEVVFVNSGALYIDKTEAQTEI